MAPETSINLKVLSVFVVAIGLSIGYSSHVLTQDNNSYCKGLEGDIETQKDFEGSVKCYKPSEVPVNVSEKVEENAELECVCKIVQNGSIKVLPVARTG